MRRTHPVVALATHVRQSPARVGECNLKGLPGHRSGTMTLIVELKSVETCHAVGGAHEISLAETSFRGGMAVTGSTRMILHL